MITYFQDETATAARQSESEANWELHVRTWNSQLGRFGKFFKGAPVVISLIVGSHLAYAVDDAAQEPVGHGDAINCSSKTNQRVGSHCWANREFKQTFSTKGALILDFIKPKVLNSGLYEHSVSNRFYDVYKGVIPVYLIYFKSQIYQDLTFERITEYIEEKNEQLNYYSYKSSNEGHDLAIADIAKFFNYMKLKRIPLNAVENHFKQALIDAKMLTINDQNVYGAGDSAIAILAVSEESSKGTLSHELNHGVYITDPTYRQSIQRYWMNLSSQSKNLVKKTLSRLSDGNLNIQKDPALFLREFAAYFRDSDTLLREYVDENEKTYESFSIILSIESGLRDIEKHTPFYHSLWPRHSLRSPR